MTVCAALLRGINVGGKNKLPMAALRELFATLGHEDVVTYIQSGNVVFTSTVKPVQAAPRHRGRRSRPSSASRCP